MVDISVQGILTLDTHDRPAQMVKTGNFLLIRYNHEILVCRLEGSTLLYDNRIRLTGPAYILEPDTVQNSIFIVLKNKILIQYDLLTKQQMQLTLLNHNNTVQVGQDEILNYDVLEDHLFIDVLYIQSLKPQTFMIPLSFQDTNRVHAEVFAHDHQNVLIAYSGAQFQQVQLRQRQTFPIITVDGGSIQKLIFYEDYLIVFADACTNIYSWPRYCLIQTIPCKNSGTFAITGNAFVSRSDNSTVRLWLDRDKSAIVHEIVRQHCGLSGYYQLNRSFAEYYDIDSGLLTCVSAKPISPSNSNCTGEQKTVQLDRVIQQQHSDCVILDYIKLLSYNRQEHLLAMSPIVVKYNVVAQQLQVLDIIHFRQMSVDTPPITQFCFACTYAVQFFAYATYDSELNMSTVKVLTVNDFVIENVFKEYEIFGQIRSISLTHDTFTVCTIVTYDGLIEVDRIEAGRGYSFTCDFDVKCAFELSQENNLYLLDGGDRGHFISVPNTFNYRFSHIRQTNKRAFDQFDYMLTVYISQLQRDGSYGKPIVLPMGVDVEAKCFVYNMRRALSGDSEGGGAGDERAGPPRPPEAEDAPNAADTPMSSVYTYYSAHRTCFEVNITNLLTRLQLYMDEITGRLRKQTRNHKQDLIDRQQDAIAGQEKLPEIHFEEKAPIGRQSELSYHSFGIIAEESSQCDSADLRRSVDRVNRQNKSTLPLQYKLLEERLEQPNFRTLRQQFKSYNEVDIINHSMYQTLNYTRLPITGCFSYNFLNIYFQCQKVGLSMEAEAVLHHILSRVLPFLSEIIDQRTEQQRNIHYRKFKQLIYKLFVCNDGFDFSVFQISFDIEQQCYHSQQSYLFTLSFVCLFTLFINISHFSTFKGHQTDDKTFELLELVLQYYLDENKKFLCIHTIVDFLKMEDNSIKYSALLLIRLYQKQMCQIWDSGISITAYTQAVEDDDQLSSGSHIRLQDPEKLYHYLQAINNDIEQILMQQHCITFDKIPTAIVILESLSRPLYYVLLQPEIGQKHKHVIKRSIIYFNNAVQTIQLLITTISEEQIDNWQSNQIIYKYAQLLVHSISFNIFYINNVYLYQQQLGLQQREHNGASAPQVRRLGSHYIEPAQQTQQLLLTLLKLSSLMTGLPMRSFMYEQITRFFVKCRDSQLFVGIVTDLLHNHQFLTCYQSIVEYLHYLRYNYSQVLEVYSVSLITVILSVASDFFKQLVHNKSAKAMIQQLLKMQLNICKGCNNVNYFTHQQKQLLFYSADNRINVFDFQQYQLFHYQFKNASVPLTLNLIKQAQLLDNVAFVGAALGTNLLIVSNNLFGHGGFIIIPLFYTQSCLQHVRQQLKDMGFQVQFGQEFHAGGRQIFFTIEVFGDQLIINITNTNIFSLTCYKIDYDGKLPENAMDFNYGMYKMKGDTLAKSHFRKRPKGIVVQVESQIIKFIIKW